MSEALFRILLACCAAALPPCGFATTQLGVARIFGDNMVLQQELPVRVWGTAAPGTEVAVSLARQKASCRTDASGRWVAVLPPLPAGGPHTLVVEGGTRREFHNVLIGEVWLASGQSNMDFRLAGAAGGAAAAAAADLPQVRFVRIPQVVDSAPREDIASAPWTICSPATAGGYSAVAFHFARELHRHRRVPVGIVNATWSGTPAEAWTSGQALAGLADFRETVVIIARRDEDWSAALREAERVDTGRDSIYARGAAGLAAGAHQPETDDQDWPEADYPLNARTMGLRDYAIAWLRKEVRIPSAWSGEDLLLDLGHCYEWDHVYFNGELVGSTRWDGARCYPVPGRLVRAGRNVISVRLYSEWSAGQLGRTGDRPVLTSPDGRFSAALDGKWKFSRDLEPELAVPVYPQRNPTAIFNGMIAPIAGFALRGALWYQGEGNADRPLQYRSLLPALIQDWRHHWGQGNFPFLVVQLPNIAAYDWPAMREAQALAARRLPAVGLVVTIDLGDPENLHPANKRPVGERLHLAARHVAYGEVCTWTGPTYRGLAFARGGVRLKFAETGSGLATLDGAPVRGFELRSANGDYQPAEAFIDGDTVVVLSRLAEPPAAVRYAWAPDPRANLCNREGLPAAPFRTDLDQ